MGRLVIRNYDVASLYPSIMIQNDLISRNIPDPADFRQIYHDRLEAKRLGNKRIDKPYKLVLNTTFGASLDKYNRLYDALMGRSVCINGQLYLTDLACGYLQHCETVQLLDLNTDGVMFAIDEDELWKIKHINREWMNRTGFILEEDKIKKVIKKDVNNYILIKMDGSVKLKGGYVVTGISQAGAFNINNNMVAVAEAIVNFYINNIPAAEYIQSINNPIKFQLIAKAGQKFKSCYQLINGEPVECQKVNRVFATADESFGTLYKVHKETGQSEKIAVVPDHCIVSNAGLPNIKSIDKSWYIELAEKRIREFTQPKKKGRKRQNE